MSHSDDKYEPTPEYLARLDKEVIRTFRSDERFGPLAPLPRTHRIVVAFGIAAGVVLTLLTGVVLGASASYAAAATPTVPRSAFAILPIKDVVNAIACSPAPQVTRSAHPTTPPQQTIPIVDLPAPAAKTSIKLGAMLGLKETSDGWVLVEDAGRHQVRLFEPSLATSAIVIDSAPGSARSYGIGNAERPLIPYLGDSSLFTDAVPRQMLVLDGRGEVSRSLALLGKDDDWGINTRGAAFDAQGRLFYRKATGSSIAVTIPWSASLIPRPPARPGTVSRGGGPPVDGIVEYIGTKADSIPIHRADFSARRTDTIAYVHAPEDYLDDHGNPVGKPTVIYNKDGAAVALKQVINPVRTIDEWALLSDGTIGIVRGRDYHVDWIHPDGTRSASPKLPVEWKRLTDDDKQRLVDSLRAHLDSLEAWAQRRFKGTPAPTDSIPAQDSIRKLTGSGRCGSPGLGVPLCPPGRRQWPYEFVPLSQIADYLPPFRDGAALADRDGNMWILPRTTTQSKKGELVYDVVNPKQGLVRRVRLPLGRSIAGFGKGGVVYLQAGDIKNWFALERSVVPGVSKAPSPR